MVCYSHLFKNCPQFVVIHKVKGFGVVNKAEVGVFWNSLAFFDDPMTLISKSERYMHLRKKISLAETCSRFEEKNEEKAFSWLMFFLTSWPEPQRPGLGLLREGWLLQKLAGCLTTGKLLFLAQRDIWPL